MYMNMVTHLEQHKIKDSKIFTILTLTML